MAAITLIGCRGGVPSAPEILKKCGWEYGSRSDYTIYSQPYFIDINWKNYSWLRHWLVIRKWRPVMAMAPDYESPEQKETMLRQVDQIRRLGVRPMVCPKFDGATADIPADCVVAVSVPTGYAGFLPQSAELIGRELHLLGGHPDQFAMIINHYRQSTVISADCSAIFLKAEFGAHWEPLKNDWHYVPKNTVSTHDLIVLSGKNVAQYLASPPKNKRINRRRGKATFQIALTFCLTIAFVLTAQASGLRETIF